MAATAALSGERWARFSPLAGIAAVVFWVLGILIVEGAGDTPGDDATAETIAGYFDREEVSIYLGGLALFIGSLILIWFAGSLRAAVASVPTGAGIAPVLFGAFVVKAVFDMAFFAPQIAGAFAANESDAPLTPEAAQALWFAGDGFFIAAEYAAAFALAVTAAAILRTGVLPRWLAWVNLLVVLVLLVPPIGWAALIFAFPLWLILASILLYRREPVASSV